MVTNETVLESPEVTTIGDRLRVRVPWKRADSWQARLEDQGILSTLHLDPVARESYLEIREGADRGRLQAALQGLGA